MTSMPEGGSRNANIAVLMTCHNRREVTLSCLRSLFEQRCDIARLSVFLVDDGSSDGTASSIAAKFPRVKVIQGSGQLYWGGGMRLAFAVAVNYDVDFHLWLNDDVVLDRDAVDRLLTTHEQVRRSRRGPTIIAGAVRDPVTRTTTYSGLRRRSVWHPLRFEHVEPGPLPERCETMSGNVVLVPRDAFEKLGAVDRALVHMMGDCDYGLRLASIGGEVWLAAHHVGTCPRKDRQSSNGLGDSMSSRLRDIGSTKKLPLQ